MSTLGQAEQNIGATLGVMLVAFAAPFLHLVYRYVHELLSVYSKRPWLGMRVRYFEHYGVRDSRRYTHLVNGYVVALVRTGEGNVVAVVTDQVRNRPYKPGDSGIYPVEEEGATWCRGWVMRAPVQPLLVVSALRGDVRR